MPFLVKIAHIQAFQNGLIMHFINVVFMSITTVMKLHTFEPNVSRPALTKDFNKSCYITKKKPTVNKLFPFSSETKPVLPVGVSECEFTLWTWRSSR